MLFIEKHSEPAGLTEFKRRNPKARYGDDIFDAHRTALREALLVEQKYLCAYCCRHIDMSRSSIEHIEPQHLPNGGLSTKSLDHDNLLAVCLGNDGHEQTCGQSKGNNYDAACFVSPLDPNCENILSFRPDTGELVGNDYTIDLLNLNSVKLRRARKTLMSALVKMNAEDVMRSFEEQEGRLPEFTDVARFMLREGYCSDS